MNDEAIVFLIDNAGPSQDALILALLQNGFNVEAYPSGPAFLQAYNGYRHGCLLMDLRQQETDAIAVCHELHKRGIYLPIIFLVDYGAVCDALSAQPKAGPTYYLEKPFTRFRLFELIGEASRQGSRLHMTPEARAEAATLRKTEAAMSCSEWFTLREWEIMALIASGKSSRQVAALLDMSTGSVDSHLAGLMEKTQVSSLVELGGIFSLLMDLLQPAHLFDDIIRQATYAA